MIIQRCKLCGTRSDYYDRCTAEGPWHEWEDLIGPPLVSTNFILRRSALAPENTYHSSEPEFIGEFKPRQDIEILPADAPKDMKIGWYTQTYMGCEVYKDLETKQPLLSYNDIQPGDVIYAAFITGGYAKVTVKDKKTGETDSNLYMLDFDTDDRHCWTCGGIVNKKLLSFNIELK